METLSSFFVDSKKRVMITRYVLIGWGIFTIPWMFYLGSGSALPGVFSSTERTIAVHYEHMLAAIYVTLAISAILAAADPVRHKLVVLFIIISSFAHGGVMFVDGLLETRAEVSSWLLWQSGGLFATASVFLILYPRGAPEARV